MKLKKYVIGLGTDNSGLVKGLGAADSQITAFVSKAGKLLGGLGVGAGFAKLIKDFTGIGSELKTFSDSTGLAVEDVSRLGLALEQFGGDTADAAAALNGLQDSIRQAVDWGQGPLIDVMGRYGVAVQNSNGKIKTATELYYDLADIMQGLNKAQQRDLASSLGLDESSIRLLQQGRKGVEELLASRSDMAVMTKEDAEAAREWDMALKDLKQLMTGFGRELARTTLPAIQKFAGFGKKIAAEWQKHREVIDHVANVIKNNLVPAFAFAALQIGALMKPLMLKMAPLTAIALLIDDIAVFMSNSGGKSIIGELLGDNGNKVRETLSKLFSGLGGIFKSLLTGDFKGAVKEFENLWFKLILPLGEKLGDKIREGIENNLPKMKNLLSGLGSGLAEIGKEIWDDYVEFVASIYEKIPVVGSWLADETRKAGKTAIKNQEMDTPSAVIEGAERLQAVEYIQKMYGLKSFGEAADFLKNAARKNFEGQENLREWYDKAFPSQMDAFNSGEPVPGISNPPVNNSPSNTNNIIVNQTFNGPADSAAVEKAAQDGVEKGATAVPGYTATLAFGQGAY